MNNSRTYYTQSNTRFEKKNEIIFFSSIIFIYSFYICLIWTTKLQQHSINHIHLCSVVGTWIWLYRLIADAMYLFLYAETRERETHLTFSLKITSTDAFINCIFTWITHWGLWAFSLHGWAVINAHAAVKWSRGNKRRVRERRRRELRHHTTSNNSWLSAQKSINKILILYDFHIHNRSDSS